MNNRKKGVAVGFRTRGAEYLIRISEDLGLGLDAPAMLALRDIYRKEKKDPTVSELIFDAAAAGGVASDPLRTRVGEISFPDAGMKKLFARVVSASGLSKTDRAGLSLERLAEYAAAGKTRPREEYSFEISDAGYPVFPESPSPETALVFGDGFAVRIGEKTPSQVGVPAEAAVLVFPQPDSDPYGFIKSAIPFAAEAANSGTCRTVPCGRGGLVWDLFRACGSFMLHTGQLPGEPEYPEAALASFAPAFLLVCRSRDAVGLIKKAVERGFRARQVASSFREPDVLAANTPDGLIKIKKGHLLSTMLCRRESVEAVLPVTSEAEQIVLSSDSAVRAEAVRLGGDLFSSAEAALGTGKLYAVCGRIGRDGVAPGLILALDRARRTRSPRVVASAFFPAPDGVTSCTVFSFSPESPLCERADPPVIGAYGYADREPEKPVAPPDMSSLPGRGRIYKSTAELSGETPLLEVYPELPARILCKLELFNPAGSSKDRAALNIIKRAAESGKLSAGSMIIEATSGNTGIALAAYGVPMGYRVTIVMPDSMSRERIDLMRAYGAEVVLTPGALGMSGAAAEAERIAAENPGSFIASQFSNPANPEAHETGTGPELFRDTGGRVDLFVAGIGTGGTLCGAGRYLKKVIPDVRVIGCEPASSPLITEGKAGKHAIQGIGANFIPENYDPSVVDRVVTVPDEEALSAAAGFAADYGLLVGISSGAALAAAKKLAAEPENAGKTIAAVLPDTGEHYISTGMFGK